jgi:hypothetical protein
MAAMWLVVVVGVVVGATGLAGAQLPTWSGAPVATVTGPVPSSQYAHAVAADGGLVAVGAHTQNNTDGAAYVYACPRGAACTLYATLAGPAGAAGFFGWSVAVHGTTVVVGAPLAQRAYRYDCAVAPCTLLEELQAVNSTTQGTWYGWAVAADTNYITVGAWNVSASPTTSSDGDVYFYRCPPPPAPCAQLQVVGSPNRTTADHFGDALALERGVLAVGAYAHNGGRGAVFLYDCRDADCENSRGGGGAVVQVLEPPASADPPTAYFGDSLAFTRGLHLVVGARGAGAVYVYACPNAVCTLEAMLLRPEPALAWYGWAVAAAGTESLADGVAVAVGAYDADSGNGAVYVYRWVPGTAGGAAPLVANLTSTNTTVAGQQFGAALAADSTTRTLIVGADIYQPSPGIVDGAIYLYAGACASLFLPRAHVGMALMGGCPPGLCVCVCGPDQTPVLAQEEDTPVPRQGLVAVLVVLGVLLLVGAGISLIIRQRRKRAAAAAATATTATDNESAKLVGDGDNPSTYSSTA